MTLTSGVITLVSAAPTQIQLQGGAATGGTGPYTYQWYRSTVSGFTPGGGNILAGKTALSLTDTGLIPGTQYYYALVSTDTGNSNVTIQSAQFSVSSTVAVPNQNQFDLTTVVGMVDLAMDVNTVAVQIDASQAGSLFPGQAVKVVDSVDGVPKVIAIAADSDEVFGFLNYNQKNRAYFANDAAEMSMAGNVMFLMATGAVSRGAQVQVDHSTIGGVKALVGSSGADIVGFAYDKATAAGQSIRVRLSVPSFAKA